MSEIVCGGNLYLNKNTQELLYLYGFSARSYMAKTASGDSLLIPKKEASNILEPTELKDFPCFAKSDPRLPYEFDLWWDIKRPSDIFSRVDIKFQEVIDFAKELYNKSEQFKNQMDEAESDELLALAELINK